MKANILKRFFSGVLALIAVAGLGIPRVSTPPIPPDQRVAIVPQEIVFVPPPLPPKMLPKAENTDRRGAMVEISGGKGKGGNGGGSGGEDDE